MVRGGDNNVNDIPCARDFGSELTFIDDDGERQHEIHLILDSLAYVHIENMVTDLSSSFLLLLPTNKSPKAC